MLSCVARVPLGTGPGGCRGRVSQEEGPVPRGGGESGASKGMCLGVPFPPFVDPYILGLWLGDGDSRDNRIIVGEQDVENVKRALSDAGLCVFSKIKRNAKGVAWVLRFDYPGHEHNGPSRARRELKSMGVLHNKHVPFRLLASPRKTRLSLLQGLMDTDGCAASKGRKRHSRRAEFYNSNERLVWAVRALVLSFGETPHTTKRTRKGYLPEYRVAWTPRIVNPFRLERKARHWAHLGEP